jgi:hypothetical protein
LNPTHKVKSEVVPVQATKVYKVIGVVSYTHRLLYSRERSTDNNSKIRCADPKAGLDGLQKNNLLPLLGI